MKFGVISTLRAQILENDNLASNYQSRLKTPISLEMFNLDLLVSPQEKGLVGGSPEIFIIA